jgi:hypothetical protein
VLLKRWIIHIATILLLTASSVNLSVAQINTKPHALPNLDRKLMYFGFHIGVNTMNLGLRPMDNPGNVDSVFAMETTAQSGFSLGLMSNLRITDILSLRFSPGLSFGQRTINYTMRGANDTAFYNVAKPIESTLLDFPISLRIKSARLNDFRIYAEAGIKYTYDLASKQGTDDKGAQFVKVKKNDVAFEMGTGLNIYLRYFMFTPAVKVSWGLPNTLVQEGHTYTAAINKMYTRAVMISFVFEGSL